MESLVFGVCDYIIIALTFIFSVLIGFYFRFSGGKQKTNEEYLHGGRKLSVFPVAISLMASFMSAITLLGVSAENYNHGLMFVVVNISYLFLTPIAAYLYVPVFYNLKSVSTYEYLELRFGPTIRLLASITYTLQMVLYNGIVLYAPAIVFESVTGINRVLSILIVGIACTVYSTLGGMKAVVWTDLLQSLLMYASIISVLAFAAVEVGGFSNMLHLAKEGGRIDFSNFSLDPTERHTWWSLCIGGGFVYLSLNAVNHTQIQRIQTVNTLRKAQLTMWISWPALFLLSITTCLSGLAIYTVYRDCDPLLSGKITAPDQLMPYFVVDIMTRVPGLTGLFVAGIFSASLSTVSAGCNALATVTLSDYLGKWMSPTTVLAKTLACIYGLLFVGLAFLAEYLGGILQAALTIFGAVGGPMLGVFTLGLFTVTANENGAVVGLLTGLSLTLWMSFGGPRPRTLNLPVSVAGCSNNITLTTKPISHEDNYFYLYRISYMWTAPVGFLSVMIVGLVVSILWKRKHPWEQKGKGHPYWELFTPPLAAWLKAKKGGNNIEVPLVFDRS